MEGTSSSFSLGQPDAVHLLNKILEKQDDILKRLETIEEKLAEPEPQVSVYAPARTSIRESRRTFRDISPYVRVSPSYTTTRSRAAVDLTESGAPERKRQRLSRSRSNITFNRSNNVEVEPIISPDNEETRRVTYVVGVEPTADTGSITKIITVLFYGPIGPLKCLEEVKSRVAQEFGFEWNSFQLLRHLPGNPAMTDYKDHYDLLVKKIKGEACNIKIIHPTLEESISLQVTEEAFIWEVKQNIVLSKALAQETTVDNQRLVFGGKELSNFQKLKDYSIKDNYTLHLATTKPPESMLSDRI